MSICFNAGSLKSFTAATKTDWILDSYWTTADESGSKVIEYDASTGTASLVSSLSGYITTGKWTRTATTKLYAHWKQTYTVTYNANYPASATSTSGSVPTDATEYASGATVTDGKQNQQEEQVMLQEAELSQLLSRLHFMPSGRRINAM